MARVLLSSVSEDRPAMRRLAEALRRAGHEPRIDADWIRLEELPAEAIERDEELPGTPWWSAVERAIETSDALIVGYSTATERRHLVGEYTNALWTAAAVGRPAFMARLDEARMWLFKLIGAHAFDLRRSSWERDVGPLIAALDRPASVFVGRETELAWLAHELRIGAHAAVVGEDGVGKTALVAEYARCHAAEYPGGCVVIDAGHGELGAGVALGALVRKRPRLAIIVDAADDALSSLFQGGADHVIVTARARPAGFPGPVLELAPLSREEASRLFDGRAGPTDDPAELQERREIVAAAGGLPRALVSAAELFRRGWRPASSAAEIAPFLVAAAPPSSRERLLLEGALCFAEEDVPLAWAALAGEVGAEAEAVALARRLEAAGLVRLGPDPDTITVHPAAREVLQSQIAPATLRAMQARAEQLATGWLADALAHDRSLEAPVLAHLEALASAGDREAPSPWRGALQVQLAKLHRRRGDTVYAFALLDRAARATERLRGTHGELRLIVMAHHARLARERGDHDLASRDLTEAISSAQSQPADGSVPWREVEPTAYQEALEIALTTAETLDEPADAARVAFLLADFHGRRGAWERAAPIAEQALRAARRTSEPILVARAFRLLADVALHGSRYEDARASYEEAIRRLDDLGAEELAATSRLLYTNLLLQLGRRDAAVRHAEWLRGYQRRARASWPYHAEVVQTLRLFDESAREVEE